MQYIRGVENDECECVRAFELRVFCCCAANRIPGREDLEGRIKCTNSFTLGTLDRSAVLPKTRVV